MDLSLFSASDWCVACVSQSASQENQRRRSESVNGLNPFFRLGKKNRLTLFFRGETFACSIVFRPSARDGWVSAPADHCFLPHSGRLRWWWRWRRFECELREEREREKMPQKRFHWPKFKPVVFDRNETSRCDRKRRSETKITYCRSDRTDWLTDWPKPGRYAKE